MKTEPCNWWHRWHPSCRNQWYMSLCLGCHTLGRCQPLWTSCSDDGALDRSSRSLGVCVLAAVTSGEETRCGDQSGFSAHPVGLTCLGSKRTYDEALVHLCRQPPSGEQVIECGECHDDQEQQTSRGRFEGPLRGAEMFPTRTGPENSYGLKFRWADVHISKRILWIPGSIIILPRYRPGHAFVCSPNSLWFLRLGWRGGRCSAHINLGKRTELLHLRKKGIHMRIRNTCKLLQI